MFARFFRRNRSVPPGDEVEAQPEVLLDPWLGDPALAAARQAARAGD